MRSVTRCGETSHAELASEIVDELCPVADTVNLESVCRLTFDHAQSARVIDGSTQPMPEIPTFIFRYTTRELHGRARAGIALRAWVDKQGKCVQSFLLRRRITCLARCVPSVGTLLSP